MSKPAIWLVVLFTSGFVVGFAVGHGRGNSAGNEAVRDYQQRLAAVESPDARPCIACIQDRSDTPYCKALCGPTPLPSLEKLYGPVDPCDADPESEECYGVKIRKLLPVVRERLRQAGWDNLEGGEADE